MFDNLKLQVFKKAITLLLHLTNTLTELVTVAAIASPNFLAPPPPPPRQGGSLFISLFSTLMLYLNIGSSMSQTQFGRKAGFGTLTSTFALPPLPYSYYALAPHLSEETLQFHHIKHEKACVDKLNTLIAGTELEGKTLEHIIRITHKQGPLPIFNNAAEFWNHQFYWSSMHPYGGRPPTGKLLNRIIEDFGSYDALVTELKAAAAAQFGSGWIWLIYKPQDKKLAVLKTSNAENPLVLGYSTPLLAIDVWEHAYYIDYRNNRGKYIDGFMNVVSWKAASDRFYAASLEMESSLIARKSLFLNVELPDANFD